MRAFLQKTLALTEKGAKDLVRASTYKFICDILIMSAAGIVYLFLTDALYPVLNGDTPTFNLPMYIVYGVGLLFILWVFYRLEYEAAYPSAYKESATKRISLAERLRKLSLSFFGKKDLSDVTTTLMADTATLENAFTHFAPDLIGSTFSTLLISIGLFFFNAKMALAVFWVLPVSVLLCFITKKQQDNYGRKSKIIQLSYIAKIRECIENVRDIKANNRQDAHNEIMKQRLDKFEQSSKVAELVTGVYITGAQMVLKLGIGTTMIVGIHMLVNGEIDLLTFVLFLFVASRIYDPISGGLINLAAVFNSLLSVERMIELENTKIQTGKESISNKGYDIVFDKVKFAYNDGETVLDGISFTAKQGEVTALVGPSGGGKSTAIKLAARFWDIESGKITLGGEDISGVEPETLLKSFSIVFQDVTLFNNTVMENIRIGKKDATDEEVIAASKAANCHEFVTALLKGYDTLIGENGALLSGGERQRISIARALLKDAPVILLDEATSSVDILNETALQQAISRLTKDKTVIVIAHRMRTVAGADKIILLKDGRVASVGNHVELMEKSADYQNMVRLQNASMNWSLAQ